jgi:hypothetical protein
MISCEYNKTSKIDGNKCGKKATASYQYGLGGPVLYVCGHHDTLMRQHIKNCKTMEYGPDEEIGDCPNYLKREIL